MFRYWLNWIWWDDLFIWFRNIIALIDGIIDLIQLQWLHEINYNFIKRLAAKMKLYLLYRTHLKFCASRLHMLVQTRDLTGTCCCSNTSNWTDQQCYHINTIRYWYLSGDKLCSHHLQNTKMTIFQWLFCYPNLPNN